MFRLLKIKAKKVKVKNKKLLPGTCSNIKMYTCTSMQGPINMF